MKTTPVILFTYNRLEHTLATVQALKANHLAGETDLVIFSDGAANEKAIGPVNKVREFLRSIDGFRSVEIIERDKNFGLDVNIIQGVTEVVNRFGRAIVLEDDLRTSPYFLQYMNEALDLYETEESVVSIHGYVYPIDETLPETFFIRGANCWGWGTWKRGWDHFEKDGSVLLKQLEEKKLESQFDFNNSYPFTQMLRHQIEGRNRSWAIRWYASAFLKDLYTLYPGRSLVYNAGGDGTGTHVGFDESMDVKLSMMPIKVRKKKVEQDLRVFEAFARFYDKQQHPSFLNRLKSKLKKLMP